ARRGRGGQAGVARDTRGAQRLAVDEAAVAGGEGGVGVAIGVGLVVGGDGQGGRADVQVAGYEGGAVVGGSQRPLRRHDGVVGHRAGRRGRCGEAGAAAEYGRRVTVDEAAVAGREGRVGVAVDLALVVGGDGQGSLAHGERILPTACAVARIT